MTTDQVSELIAAVSWLVFLLAMFGAMAGRISGDLVMFLARRSQTYRAFVRAMDRRFRMDMRA